jgi:polysaccharide deacetylase family protein (PEP-CTERM system associated)
MSDTARVQNAMTIDVEDYFHVSAFEGLMPRQSWDRFESRVVANTERLLSIFDEAGVRATFFVLGWVAERHPSLVRRIAGLGHEIASHGYAHRLVYDQTPRAFRDDVRRAKDLLESASGQIVLGFRAPSYSVTPQSLWAIDILIEEGYAYDASVFPIRHDRYGIPVSPRHAYVVRREAGSLIEAPASTVRWGTMNLPIAGGGYFRILPYAWTRWGISRLNTVEGQPAIFYLHPWEIDPGQPRLSGSFLSEFRHYRHLDQTEARLRTLLNDFDFTPMRDVLHDMLQGVVPDTEHCEAGLPYVW